MLYSAWQTSANNTYDMTNCYYLCYTQNIHRSLYWQMIHFHESLFLNTCVCVCGHTCVCAHMCARMPTHLSCIQFCATLQTAACQAPLCTGKILEWVAMPSSTGSTWARDQTHVSYVSCTDRWVPTSANWEAHVCIYH